MKITKIFSFLVLLVQLIPGSVQDETTTGIISVPPNSDLYTENKATGLPKRSVTSYQTSHIPRSSEPMGQTSWEQTSVPSTQTSEYVCDIWNWNYWDYDFYRDSIDGSRFDWWYANSNWTSAYWHYNSDWNYGRLSLMDTIYTSRCQRSVCTGKDIINITEEIQQDCCEYKNTWYHHAQPIYKDDCIGYLCLNGTWLITNHSDPECCSDIYYKLQYETTTSYAETSSTETMWTTSPKMDTFPSIFTTVGTTMSRRKRGIYWEYLYYYSYSEKFPWWDESINGTTSWYTQYNDNKDELENSDLPLNGIAYTGSCEKLVCIGKENINRTGKIHPKCCSHNGDWFHHGYPMYENNCTAQVCSEGEWQQLDHIDPHCCSDIYYKLQYETTPTYTETSSTQTMWTTSPKMDTFSSIFTTISPTMSRRKRGIDWEYISYYSYSEKFPWWDESINGTTSWYTQYNDNKDELENSDLPLNGIAYTGSCEKLVCIGRENINRTGETHAKCCVYDGDWYHHGYPMYKNDCSAQVCEGGNWVKINYSDPNCCESWGIDGWNEYKFERDYLDWTQFSWWFDNYQWYDEYYTYDAGYTSLNNSLYTSRCQRFICVARNTLTITEEIKEDCCEYNMTWYHHGQPIYKDDCIGYVCVNGSWLRTNHYDKKCCVNPDIESVLPDYNYNYYYDYYYYVNTQYPRPKRWHKLNETIVIADCQEVTCASRDNWVPTGEVIPDCNNHPGCDFDEVHYNHTARLPGCFQVFCSRGMWVQMGHIDKNCSLCTAYWDPHLITFDGHNFDYHGTCEYAMAQDGTTTNPQYAVNSEFMECWGNACVGPSTFIDSPMTVVKMGAFGRYTPDLYKILVNGELYEIPDGTPRLVKEGTTEHPVLAWRYRYGCIRLLGSSKIAVEKCGSSLSIWASPEFHADLHGLCGYFDGVVSNDFSKRDGSTSPLNRYPAGEEFPDSWETTCAMGGLQGATTERPLRRIKRSEAANCTLEKDVEDKLRGKCNQTIDTSGSLSREMISILIENCVYDTCSIYQNTSGNENAIEEWMEDIQTSVEDISDVENKTTDIDVLPEILFQDTVLKPNTTAEAESPGSPLPPKYTTLEQNTAVEDKTTEEADASIEDEYSGSQLFQNNETKMKNILLNVIMKVNMRKPCKK